MSPPRNYDIVVFGATGFTGKLVAAYLAAAEEPFKWAIAPTSGSQQHDLARRQVGRLYPGSQPVGS